jgi:hypothetical protein
LSQFNVFGVNGKDWIRIMLDNSRNPKYWSQQTILKIVPSQPVVLLWWIFLCAIFPWNDDACSDSVVIVHAFQSSSLPRSWTTLVSSLSSSSDDDTSVNGDIINTIINDNVNSNSKNSDYVVPIRDTLMMPSSNINGYTGTQSYNALLSKSRNNKNKGKSKWDQLFPTSSQNTQNSMDDNYDENEDGWGDMRKKRPSYIRKIATLFPPIKVTWRAIFPKQQIEPGTLILVRHGESGTYVL